LEPKKSRNSNQSCPTDLLFVDLNELKNSVGPEGNQVETLSSLPTEFRLRAFERNDLTNT
jgi:hypothetical protein